MSKRIDRRNNEKDSKIIFDYGSYSCRMYYSMWSECDKKYSK